MQISAWIGLCSVLRPLQHSIGYMGDGFYRSKDPTNSIKVIKEATKEHNRKAQLSLTNPRDATRKPAKIAPIRRAYNVVADNTGLSSFV